MKKLFKWIIWVIVTLVIIVILGAVIFYFWIQSRGEHKQEALQYNQTKVVQMIDNQLEGLDIESIRSKEKMIIEKDIESLQKDIDNNKLTYTELTAFYLDRMKEIDQIPDGVNAIAEVNPKAIKQAKELDRQKTTKKSPLYGMPITFKDNINVVGMPMSAGTYYLKDYLPTEDAEIVKQLKKQKIIVLGKANLSELANYMSPKLPSGYSSKVGQTRNPFGPLKISPLGSSAGSAASVTSNIGVASIGTETTGSIIAPAAIESTVGFKPSREKIDGSGIFPLSSTLDTAGPITKTVKDATLIYQGMIKELWEEPLQDKDLTGMRLGVTSSLNSLEDELKETLKKMGIELVDISLDSEGIENVKIINNDFKFDIADFAKKYELPFSTLGELIDYNQKDMKRRAKYGQSDLEDANKITHRDKQYNNNQVTLAKEKLQKIQKDKQIDVIVTFNNDSVLLPAVAGYPVITVPFGKDTSGEPQGVTFISLDGKTKPVLEIANAFEGNTLKRTIPKFHEK